MTMYKKREMIYLKREGLEGGKEEGGDGGRI
jgi:hypothetical protein